MRPYSYLTKQLVSILLTFGPQTTEQIFPRAAENRKLGLTKKRLYFHLRKLCDQKIIAKSQDRIYTLIPGQHIKVFESKPKPPKPPSAAKTLLPSDVLKITPTSVFDLYRVRTRATNLDSEGG